MFSFVSKNQTECRIVRIFWNDGLLDLLAGAGVILMGMAWLAGRVPLGAVVPAFLLPFWRPLRNWITEPRRGFVELSDAQEGRNRAFLITSILIGVAAFLICLAIYLVVNRSSSVRSFGVRGYPPSFWQGWP